LPPLFGIFGGFFPARLLFLWLLFLTGTGRMVFLATREPLAPETPRKVYGWFFTVHRASLAAVVAGGCFIGGFSIKMRSF
jgi:hypothetical protein